MSEIVSFPAKHLLDSLPFNLLKGFEADAGASPSSTLLKQLGYHLVKLLI
jgi:hypothetical protein